MTDHVTDSADRIVVGVDGSPGSKTALKWAMNQARLTGATVEAITSWQDPAQYGTAYGWTVAAFEGDTFAGVILGSVGQHCVQHATCPVVVVP